MRQTAVWLSRVEEELGAGVEIEYRSFVLEQANSENGEGWKAWEQGEDYVSRGLDSLRGGAAARRQGREAHNAYMLAVLEAKHVRREDIRSFDAVATCAKTVGLDEERFAKDFNDPAILEEIARDHEYAVGEGVFGTPTFKFEDGSLAFLKMYTPPESETMASFRNFVGIANGRKYFGELKRPQPPWPRGALD